MRSLRPDTTEEALVSGLKEVANFAEDIEEFDPIDDNDGRKKVLREVAIRQGQAKFRESLIEAYEAKCAISGCAIVPALQAAHIAPYNGIRTNHVTNGLLLRADIHTLFDLGLLRIDPDTHLISVAADLEATDYHAYHGASVTLPSVASRRPNREALKKKFALSISQPAV